MMGKISRNAMYFAAREIIIRCVDEPGEMGFYMEKDFLLEYCADLIKAAKSGGKRIELTGFVNPANLDRLESMLHEVQGGAKQ